MSVAKDTRRDGPLQVVMWWAFIMSKSKKEA